MPHPSLVQRPGIDLRCAYVGVGRIADVEVVSVELNQNQPTLGETKKYNWDVRNFEPESVVYFVYVGHLTENRSQLFNVHRAVYDRNGSLRPYFGTSTRFAPVFKDPFHSTRDVFLGVIGRKVIRKLTNSVQNARAIRPQRNHPEATFLAVMTACADRNMELNPSMTVARASEDIRPLIARVF